MRDLAISMKSEIVPELGHKAKTTATCTLNRFIMHAGPYKDLDIVIIVPYKLPGGISKCKAVKFSGVSAIDGTYVWTYKGSETCPG